MCDPTGGIATTALLIGGAGVSAYGQYQQGQAAKDAAEYQAAVSRNNAIMEDRRAQQELEAGDREAIQRRRAIAQLIGQQRANVGASGVEASGSPLEVIADTAEQGTLDMATIRYNAELRAQDRRFSAQNLRAQSVLQEFEGRSAARAGQIGAFGTILGGAGQASLAYKTFKG